MSVKGVPMLRTLLFLYEGIRLSTLVFRKLRGQKIILSYKDLVILLATNWDLIAELIKKNPVLKDKFLKILQTLRKK